MQKLKSKYVYGDQMSQVKVVARTQFCTCAEVAVVFVARASSKLTHARNNKFMHGEAKTYCYKGAGLAHQTVTFSLKDCSHASQWSRHQKEMYN